MINAFQIKQYISQIQSSRVRDRRLMPLLTIFQLYHGGQF